ncbi:MAG: endonuclease/exonuclease/phosphatase [Ignavibacteria bacterium]|nr:MAG: endonuclease/exonuclease/phosphatase [Ignavibacteria bacterium]KAF0154936.1 MAG: endonuclease/exonuclease/phosphatase [Ignavibacteria bacterium]
MKILSYNINNGCKGNEDLLFDFFNKASIDIIGLNELNGWDQTKLEEFSTKHGFCSCYIIKSQKSEYKVGLVSKFPIDGVIEYNENFHHAALLAIVKDINLIVTHLTPHDSVKRELECIELISIMSKINGKILLMGDLNTLSNEDSSYYDDSYLRVFSNSKKLKSKFLSNKLEINYSPMQILLNSGMEDLSTKGVFDNTVPTQNFADPMHALPMRLDYILSKNITSNSEVRTIKDDVTNSLSDHYPVAIEV